MSLRRPVAAFNQIIGQTSTVLGSAVKSWLEHSSDLKHEPLSAV